MTFIRAHKINNKKIEDYSKLWRIVDGAVYDAVTKHPDYFTEKGHQCVVSSITKRVVGQIVGYLEGAQGAGPFVGHMDDTSLL